MIFSVVCGGFSKTTKKITHFFLMFLFRVGDIFRNGPWKWEKNGRLVGAARSPMESSGPGLSILESSARNGYSGVLIEMLV